MPAIQLAVFENKFSSKTIANYRMQVQKACVEEKSRSPGFTANSPHFGFSNEYRLGTIQPILSEKSREKTEANITRLQKISFSSISQTSQNISYVGQQHMGTILEKVQFFKF